MGLFSYMYYQSFIGSGLSTADAILQAFSLLSSQEQQEVYKMLAELIAQ